MTAIFDIAVALETWREACDGIHPLGVGRITVWRGPEWQIGSYQGGEGSKPG